VIREIAKTPYEEFPIYFTFGSRMQRAEMLASYTLACANAVTGADTGTDIVDSDTLASGKVKVVIKGGTNGEVHKITCLGTSDLGYDYETEIFVVIKSEVSDYCEKQEADNINIRNDFTEDIESGDTVSTHAVTSIKNDLTSSTAAIIDGSSIENPYIYVGFKGGGDSDYHVISIKIVSANGYKYEKLLLLAIKEQ